MKNFLNHVREEAVKHALYRRTRNEIAGMSPREALELGMFPGDAHRIAHEAVYG